MLMNENETYGEARFKVSDNVITRSIPVFDNCGNQTGIIREPIMDKDTFLECYHKWVETEYDDIDIDQDDWGN